MKRLLGLVVAVAVLAGVASAYADGGCSGMVGKSSAGGCCSAMFSKLDLTSQQKAQVTALQEQCKRATSTSESHEMFTKGVEKILTPEQLIQWKANMEKSSKGGQCPFAKSAEKS
jgi:hypothetical protein